MNSAECWVGRVFVVAGILIWLFGGYREAGAFIVACGAALIASAAYERAGE